ncbi:HalOD1 output domain-containing protein [Halovivax gelatinilyticus]|uniref:HalOD1 output domain-containing protein n=1 Tax=Halovivax gelatinilyticus TaxID=2961597 RepID=UPI0020CA6468|nr:HalOD1 output domain-containing protein [Halovivax gelatinilyticus]
MTTPTPSTNSHRRDLTMAITDAVADATDSEPLELTPLYEAIDPDALGALFAGRESTGKEITFTYEGRRVTVTDKSQVIVGKEQSV